MRGESNQVTPFFLAKAQVPPLSLSFSYPIPFAPFSNISVHHHSSILSVSLSLAVSLIFHMFVIIV